MSNLLTKIEVDLTEALKEKDEVKISILRFLLAQIHNAQIAKGKSSPLTDSEVKAEIGKEVRRHKESIEAFEKAQRVDLVEREKKELEILETYLPPSLTDDKVSQIVSEGITETGANSLSDFGKVMAHVMPKIAGRTEGATVAEIVKEMLTKLAMADV